jgi:hypothetical protein
VVERDFASMDFKQLKVALQNQKKDLDNVLQLA